MNNVNSHLMVPLPNVGDQKSPTHIIEISMKCISLNNFGKTVNQSLNGLTGQALKFPEEVDFYFYLNAHSLRVDDESHNL